MKVKGLIDKLHRVELWSIVDGKVVVIRDVEIKNRFYQHTINYLMKI